MMLRFVQTSIAIVVALLLVGNTAVAQTPRKAAVDAPVTGEDLELGPQKSALARLRDKLKRASTLLSEKRTDNAVVDLQVEIEFDLEDLLRQTGGSSSQASGTASQQAANETRPDTNATNAEKNASASKGGTSGANRNPLKSLVRDSWGNLPDRARQELQSVSGEDFLPKYQRMIERYYRRLADEANRRKRESPGEDTNSNKRP
jgi:hypothetical protein